MIFYRIINCKRFEYFIEDEESVIVEVFVYENNELIYSTKTHMMKNFLYFVELLSCFFDKKVIIKFNNQNIEFNIDGLEKSESFKIKMQKYSKYLKFENIVEYNQYLNFDKNSIIIKATNIFENDIINFETSYQKIKKEEFIIIKNINNDNLSSWLNKIEEYEIKLPQFYFEIIQLDFDKNINNLIKITYKNYKQLVVIITHNGGKMLLDLLKDVNYFNIQNNEVCIVDNLSTDKKHIEYLETLKTLGYKILFNLNDTYEIGGFKLAIDTFKSEYWYFFQDSIRLKQNIFEIVRPKLTIKNVYTLLTFNIPSLSYKDFVMEFLTKNYQQIEYKNGILGCMFFAKDEVIQLIESSLILPKNKKESMAMELGISILLERYNIEIIGLDVFDDRANTNAGFDTYTFFKKIAMSSYR